MMHYELYGTEISAKYKYTREDGIKFLNFIYPPSDQPDWIKALISDNEFTTIQIHVDQDKIKEVYFGCYDTGKFFDKEIYHVVVSGFKQFDKSFKSISREYNLLQIGL